eukprot:superscaffoldBa00006775_g21876
MHHKYEGKTPAYSLVAKNESVKAERTADTPQKLRVRQREGDRAQHTWHAAPAGCCRKEGRASWESGGLETPQGGQGLEATHVLQTKLKQLCS